MALSPAVLKLVAVAFSAINLIELPVITLAGRNDPTITLTGRNDPTITLAGQV